MNRQLTLGSLFDGSGGFPLGAVFNRIIPVWASEIEPFPIRVTTRRLPQMKHYGDIGQIDGSMIEPVDIITFGSPCTDMSVAGKRAGLDGKQSALFYEAIRIIKEMRCATNGRNPRFILWENVPGAFSSNKGADFKAVLEAVVQIAEPDAEVPAPDKNGWPYADILLGNGWSVAYRTVDAQFFGVAQRRKRIYLVADFGSEHAGEILFEHQGVSRDYTPCGSPGQRTPGSSEDCAGEPVRVLNDQGGACMSVTEELVATLRVQEHGHQPIVFEPGAASRLGGHSDEGLSGTLRADMGDNQLAVVIENHPTDSRVTLGTSGKVQTLTSRMGTGGGNVPLTLKIRSGCEGGGKGALIQDNKSATLGCNNDQTVFVPFVKGTRPHSSDEGQQWKDGTVANTLNTHDVGESRCNELAVKVYGICSKQSHAMLSDNPHAGVYEAQTSRTLDTSGSSPQCHQGGMLVVAPVESPCYCL
ncbi:MAG TPA: DNA (cytosine-5-)-methyltransferase, partial [Bacteroidales bacterium]|nr:DNA (cytosine-5-)-methyltransferase [Bacteroidales bacterium]